MLRRPPWRAPSLALLAVLAAAPAVATTYVLPADEQLVDQAAVVVVGTVEEVAPAAGGALPLTEVRVRVEGRLKGRAAAPEVRVRVLGGRAAGGRRLIVRGAPAFRRGERVLLFLVPHTDGAYRLLHFGLGAFHEQTSAGRRLALRDLAEAQVLAPDGGVAPEPVRDFAAFARWVRERAAGRAGRPDYLVARPAGPRAVAEPYTFLGVTPHRWLEFVAGQQVGWFAHEDGQPGLAGGGFTEFQAAIAAWNDDRASAVRDRYDGTTTADAGFTGSDSVNAILFEDPNGEVGGTFTCSFPGSGSGILAIGGFWTDDADPLVIAEGDVIVNDGAGCWFSTGKRAEQVYGHELGHALGMGHSCGDFGSPCDSLTSQALMRASAHPDNRGAKLNGDDKAGIAALYPAATSFFTLSPCRLLDTRNPMNPNGGPALTDGVSRAFPVAGICGVPPTALAVTVNLTVTLATGPGHIGVHPPHSSLVTTTAIEFGAVQTRSSNTVLALSFEPPGWVTVAPTVSGGGQVHLIVDVAGWYE